MEDIVEKYWRLLQYYGRGFTQLFEVCLMTSFLHHNQAGIVHLNHLVFHASSKQRFIHSGWHGVTKTKVSSFRQGGFHFEVSRGFKKPKFPRKLRNLETPMSALSMTQISRQYSS